MIEVICGSWGLSSVPDCIGSHLHLCSFIVHGAEDPTLPLRFIIVGCWQLFTLDTLDKLRGGCDPALPVLLAFLLLVVVWALLGPVFRHIVVLGPWDIMLSLSVNFDKLLRRWVHFLWK